MLHLHEKVFGERLGGILLVSEFFGGGVGQLALYKHLAEAQGRIFFFSRNAMGMMSEGDRPQDSTILHLAGYCMAVLYRVPLSRHPGKARAVRSIIACCAWQRSGFRRQRPYIASRLRPQGKVLILQPSRNL